MQCDIWNLEEGVREKVWVMLVSVVADMVLSYLVLYSSNVLCVLGFVFMCNFG